MLIARIIGALLVVAAAIVLGHDVMNWLRTGLLAPIAAGALWFALDSSSLNLMQAVIQRYIAAWLWDPVITTILLCWAWAVLFVPGALLVWLSGIRDRRRRQPGRTRMQ